jgi:2,3-bisphosphoglycerate-independent phosphoglycerate mutase
LKAALIIIDGMADRTQETLGGLTPLQAASLPNLDSLACAGACGHMYPVAPGICPSSDQALWRILGYGDTDYPGRASIETLGAGIDLNEGDTVFRVNLATTMVDVGQRYMQVSPAYLGEEQAVEVARSLAGYKPIHFNCELYHLGGPFMALVLSGGASARVTDSDPLFFRLPVPKIVALSGGGAAAEKTAEELENFTSWAVGVLASHPVNQAREAESRPSINHVLIKWPSTVPDVPSFAEAWSFNAAVIASGQFYSGIARVLGMEYHQKKSDDVGEEFYDKLIAARRALDSGLDFAFVHTKAADEASHRGKPGRKVGVLQELDMALTAVVESFAGDPELLTVITADHSTPSSGTDDVIHSGESVPIVMVGANTRVDAVTSFDEVSCAAGSLGLIGGRDIMPLILNATNRAAFGLSRLDPEERPYHASW